ncbi:MAG: ABC transporter ATP-binding protein [Bryobacter sp.]|nr:ABC transporter ATP-binding protein [Bryobacter sp.]
MKRVLRLGLHYWPSLLGATFLMAIVGIAQGLTALLIKPLLDRVLNPTATAERVELIQLPGFPEPLYLDSFVPPQITSVWTMVAFAILTVFAIRGLCDYFGNYLINHVGLSTITDLRQRVFEQVLRQDASFFENTSTGRLMSSIMSDIEKIQVAASHMLADWLRQSFSALGLLAVLLRHDWKLALISLTVVPFVLVPTARLGRRIRRSTRTAQDDAAQLSHTIQEAISGHAVVRAFGAEAWESEKFRNAAQRLKRSSLRYVAQQALPSPIIEFLGACTIVGLLAYARVQIEAGQLTAGEFTSFVIALLMLYEPVKRLTGIHNIFQQAAGSAERVFEYLDREPLVRNLPHAKPVAAFAQALSFTDVHFRYPTNPPEQADILNGISFTLPRGQVLALVGPSGAGKSTIASLVLRAYDPHSGSVQLDGQDYRSLDLASLRRQISVVAQDTFLFDDTVANNIRYGRPSARDEEVQAAARAALAAEFIERLPEGYATRIGERGFKLSGGQRQRLAIARAFLSQAPILILDEATSHLDTESEALVQKALAQLMENHTVLVIAHRLSTVRRANRILVLDQGRIAEAGTHDELLALGGLYTRLYELQFQESAKLEYP